MSKYPRTYHLPWSPGTTSDDRISKSIEKLLNRKVVITEKLDGENTGMTNLGTYARSHATFTESAWSKEVRQIQSIKVKGYIEDNVTLFGENMEGIHSIEYSNLKSYFYLFGVRKDNIWLSWDKVEEYSYLLDLELAPVLYVGEFKTIDELRNKTEELVSMDSELGGKREGIVIRIYDEFDQDDFDTVVQKWVRKNHVQTDEHWTRNWKKAKINYEE